MTGARLEPVADAGWAAATATVLTGAAVHVLAEHGLLLPDGVGAALAELLEVGIVTAAGALGSLAAAYWSRRRVTPLADPRDDAGQPLLGHTPDDPPEHSADAPPGAWVDVAALRREYHLDPPRRP
ncbi:hypothetical protein [Geodermatophilus chilensis]|uniref:hypothetical protein n=1 Tax=Geodermatophilus chilensis TaxID=2035835 RepID=UPI0012FFE3D4|nr:hypothetical protein [Geodermatophilus chilensis]